MNSDSDILVSRIRVPITNYGPNSRSTVIVSLRNCSPAPGMGWKSTDAQTSTRALVERSEDPPTPSGLRLALVGEGDLTMETIHSIQGHSAAP